MTLPNFLIIGAAKSGTSSLYMYLKQHPEIFMSPVKEPHFFSFTDETKNTRGPGDSIPGAVTDILAYEELFDGVKNQKAIGEASPTYLYQPEAAKRIFELIPDVKIIVILRHPAERAFSAYMHVVRDRREDALNFGEALKLEDERKKNDWGPLWHYTSAGFYYDQLSRFYELFSGDQIKVFLYEELQKNELDLLKDIFNFLEVDPNFMPDSSIRFNVSGEQKSKFVHTLSLFLFNQKNPIRWLSRKFIPESWRWKFTCLVRDINLNKQSIPPKIKKDLINLYREDIMNLETLIKKDLSHWLEL